MAYYKDLYTDIWINKRTKRKSHGEALVPLASQLLLLGDQGSITFFGCGTGKECLAMSKEHPLLKIQANDVTKAALLNSDITFFENPLWNMNYIPESTYGFCADVLEYIPKPLLRDALYSIKQVVQKRVYFSISLISGSWCKEHLHVINKEPAEWRALLNEHFMETYSDSDATHFYYAGELKGC